MKLTSILLLFSSALAVKVQHMDMMEDFDSEPTQLSEAWADVAMPSSFDSTVYISGGKDVNQPTFLSCHHDHHHWVDLWWSDDNSGRQKWHFTRYGNTNQYVITVPNGRGSNRRTLSVPQCGNDGVDLWTNDDASGRQRWAITPLGGQTFTLQIVNGRNGCGRNFLSTDTGSAHVDLWYQDDDSGRQKWVIPGFPQGNQNEIASITGYWNLAASSNHSIAKTLTKSVTNSRGETLGNSQTTDFSVTSTTSVTADFFFGSATQEISVSAGVSNTISRETSTQLDQSTESSCTASCPNPASGRMYLFQWATRSTANSGSTLNMLTCHYSCQTSSAGPSATPFG